MARPDKGVIVGKEEPRRTECAHPISSVREDERSHAVLCLLVRLSEGGGGASRLAAAVLAAQLATNHRGIRHGGLCDGWHDGKGNDDGWVEGTLQ